MGTKRKINTKAKMAKKNRIATRCQFFFHHLGLSNCKSAVNIRLVFFNIIKMLFHPFHKIGIHRFNHIRTTCDGCRTGV